MSRKAFIILITAAVILGLFVLGLFLYFNAKKNNGGGPVTIKDFFPFGPGNGGPQGGGQQGGGQTTGTIEQPPTNGKTPRLRKVSNDPVTGYTTLKKEVPVDPNSVPPPKQVPVATTYTFTKDLKLKDTGTDITELQKFLNQCPATQVAKTGAGSPGKEGKTFTAATEKAVVEFQEMFRDEILAPQNLSVGSGIVDELTRKKIQSGFTCIIPAEVPATVIRDIVRYVARGTSNIYDAFADTLQTTRLSATTIPRVHESFFADNGKAVFLRSLQADNLTIETLIGRISEPVVGGDGLPELSVFAMPKNIEDITVSPDQKSILFLIPSGDSLVGFTSDLDGKNQKKVFSSKFMGWLSQWATPSKLIFTIKATGYARGYAFSTDITKGDFTKIAGPISALTTLMSPDGRYLLYGRNTKDGPNLAVMDMTTKKSKSLDVATLPEKCVWNKASTDVFCSVPVVIPAGETYPDAWYQGKVTFSDTFWDINVAGVLGGTQLFSPLNEGGEPTDGVKLRVDEAGRYLYFVNQDTGILWQYDLNPPVEKTI